MLRWVLTAADIMHINAHVRLYWIASLLSRQCDRSITHGFISSKISEQLQQTTNYYTLAFAVVVAQDYCVSHSGRLGESDAMMTTACSTESRTAQAQCVLDGQEVCGQRNDPIHQRTQKSVTGFVNLLTVGKPAVRLKLWTQLLESLHSKFDAIFALPNSIMLDSSLAVKAVVVGRPTTRKWTIAPKQKSYQNRIRILWSCKLVHKTNDEPTQLVDSS